MISGIFRESNGRWRTMVIVLLYSIIAVVSGVILKRLAAPEQFLLILIVPIIAMSVNRPRTAYVLMILVVALTTFWVTHNWRIEIDESFVTIVAIAVSLFVTCEVVSATERKRRHTLTALRESREQYDIMARSSMDGYWLVGANGYPIEVNDAYCRMSGFSRETLMTMNVADIECQETPEQVVEHTRRIMENGWDRFESCHRRADGSMMHVDISAIYAPSRNEIIAFIHDVTERKRAERELLETRDHLAATLNALPDLLFEIDREGRILDYRAPQPEVLYRRPSEFLGKTIAEVLPPNACAVIRQGITEAARTGFHRGLEYSLPMPGGVEWYELAIAAKGNPQAPDARFVALVRDITVRRRAEMSLRESESLLKESEAVARLGTYVLDIQSGIWRSSNVLDEIFGVDETFTHSVEGWTALIHPDFRDDMRVYFTNEVLGNHVLFDREYKILHPSTGEERWVHGLGRLEFDENNQPIRMFGTIQDITARKQTEAEHERLEAQLRQSQKMEAVGQLAGGIAHDFNNLLQAILGYTEYVLDNMPLDAPYRTELQQTQRAAERAAVLTRQLLAYSRKQVLKPQPLNLNEVIVELMRMIQRAIGEHIEFEFVCGPVLPLVNADRGQFEQVLTNLCLNARDAMPNGGKLTIETANVTLTADDLAATDWALPGRYVAVSVTDTGAGMNTETTQKVFEPFFTTKDVGKGTGLGLATVHGIIRQHEGVIRVESELGTGTTFRLYLPALDTAERASESRADVLAPVRGGHETILLAEDEELIRELARKVLETAGYRVICAVDGEDALHAFGLQPDRIDLLVLDVVMPRASGRVVLDEIRRARPSQKCLFVSGYSEDAIHTRFVLDTGLRLLQKPYHRDALLRAVRDVLDQ